MPQIRGFAVQDGITQTITAAVEAYGLKILKGSDGEADVLEDIPELAKTYKVGDPIQFTCTFNAIVDPEQQPSEGESDDDGVIDADVVEE